MKLEYRPMLAVDIERSAGRGDSALMRIREVLFASMRQSWEQAGLHWDDCVRDDLGDGLRIVAAVGTPKARLVHPLIHELGVRLRAHNRSAAQSTRLRVRMALHAGDVRIDGDGRPVGRPLEVLARLLDADPLRQALARAPQGDPVAAVLSQHFHDETVGHDHPGVEAPAFRPISVTVKQFRADAWLYVPHLTVTAPTGRIPTNREGVTMDADLVLLAESAATALVTAMATDLWPEMRKAASELFHRKEPVQQLDSDADLVEHAADPDETRSELVEIWSRRFSDLIGGGDPAPVAGVEGLTRLFAPATPSPAQVARRQVNTARDSGTVYAVQDGNQYIHRPPG
ncbi:MAG: hypothetical protein HOQ24_12710 [Mycobacteriaceae bacterium]|nr:hypothetical protein [Mycobacteriaceae bacterium]